MNLNGENEMRYFEFHLGCPPELSACFLWWHSWLLANSACRSPSLRPFHPHLEAESGLNLRPCLKIPWSQCHRSQGFSIQPTACTQALATGFLFGCQGSRIWPNLFRSSDHPLTLLVLPWVTANSSRSASACCNSLIQPRVCADDVFSSLCLIKVSDPPTRSQSRHSSVPGAVCLNNSCHLVPWMHTLPSWMAILPLATLLDRRLLTRWVGLTYSFLL